MNRQKGRNLNPEICVTTVISGSFIDFSRKTSAAENNKKMMSANSNQLSVIAKTSGSSQRTLRTRAPASEKILVSPYVFGDDINYSEKDSHFLTVFLQHIKEDKSGLLNMTKWKVPRGFEKSSLNNLNKFMKELSKRCHQLKMSNTSDLPRTADFELWNQANCNFAMTEAIMSLVYKLTIRDATILANKKKHETYGEVMPAQLAQFCEKLNMGPDDVFLDLGSGIGNTVCYIAGACQIKQAVGIELLDAPAAYAKEMEANFKEVMKFYGKKKSPIALYQGNLFDPKWEETILEATVIYTNNFIFDEEMNVKLEAIFMKCPKKPKIISSKSFIGKRMKNNQKYQEGLRGATEEEIFEGFPNNTSWTGQPVQFFLLEFKDTVNIPAANNSVIAHNVNDGEDVQEEEDDKENRMEDQEDMMMDREIENEEHQYDDQREIDIDLDYGYDAPVFDNLDGMEPLPFDDFELDRYDLQMEVEDEEDGMDVPEAAGDNDEESEEEEEEEPRFHDGVVGSLRSRETYEGKYCPQVFHRAIAETVKRHKRN